jgi:predicted SnoaL-like aldol condensation-catalyzing enzyme
MAGGRDLALEARNKQLALDMWQAVIVEFEAEAVLRYISPGYVQHNPAVPPGREFLFEAVKQLAAERDANPGAPPHTTKRLIEAVADGDLVVLTWNLDVPEPDDPARTYVACSFDMFRYDADGMITEHWDDVRKGAPH